MLFLKMLSLSTVDFICIYSPLAILDVLEFCWRSFGVSFVIVVHVPPLDRLKTLDFCSVMFLIVS